MQQVYETLAYFGVFAAILVVGILTVIRRGSSSARVKAEYRRAGIALSATADGEIAVGAHAGMSFTHGTAYARTVRGGRSPRGAVVTVRSALTGEFMVRRERGVERLFKLIGFAAEAQTGDAAFDRKFYLHGASREYVQAFFAELQDRDAVRALFRLGFHTVELADGEISATTKQRYPLELSMLTGAAERLASMLASSTMMAVAGRGTGISTRQITAMCAGALVLALVLFAVCLGGTRPYVDGWIAVAVGIWPAVATACAALLGAAIVALRGRAAAHRELLAVVFMGVPAIALGTMGAVVLANEHLDGSELRGLEARLVDTRATPGRSRLFFDTPPGYQLMLQIQRPGWSQVEIRVSEETYRSATMDQRWIVRTRSGRVGFEWVESAGRIEKGTATPVAR